MQLDLATLNFKDARLVLLKATEEWIEVGGINPQKIWKLARFVPLYFTARIIGLWFGDGDKVRSVGITNTELSLVRMFLRFLEILKIDKRKVLVEVVAPQTQVIVKKEVARIFEIPEVRVRVRTLKTAKHVTWRIRVFSRILARIFFALFEKIKELDDQKVKIEFLKGLVAAEGCIGLRRDKKIHNVYISLKSKEEREMIKSYFLQPLKIKTIKDSGDSIRIGHKENLKRVYKFKLFELHPHKHRKFISSFYC